jgi:hypothetical protein
MRYRQLDADGDYLLNTFLKDSPDCVGQAIGTRLRLGQGEWFLDTTEGTPWKTKVLGKYTGDLYDPAIKSRILGTPGVLELVSYSSSRDPNTRKLTVTATVSTIYGANVTIEETL